MLTVYLEANTHTTIVESALESADSSVESTDSNADSTVAM